jgi:hypothetical protein
MYFAIIAAIQPGKINRLKRALRKRLKAFGFRSADEAEKTVHTYDFLER